jgi:actin related protein 2/3 complex subunit 1A/1B
MSTEHQLTPPTQGVSCHAWNGDKSSKLNTWLATPSSLNSLLHHLFAVIAISPNNNEIHIYETTNWTRLFLLSEVIPFENKLNWCMYGFTSMPSIFEIPQHDLMVSSLDWSSVTNKIVSCSHDRNAFVWTFQPDLGTWKPALVILRIDRAALDVRWSFDGKRFAVTSGSKCVPVCTYDLTNDWWVQPFFLCVDVCVFDYFWNFQYWTNLIEYYDSINFRWVCKMVKKKFKSTVLCCAFHPTNGQLLATGCADFKMRIYRTFATDVDGSAVDAGPFATSHGPLEFGEVYVELSALGLIHAVAWSPSGNILAYTG